MATSPSDRMDRGSWIIVGIFTVAVLAAKLFGIV